ncbi:inorganic pyrophosphatase [Zychaea mexicana]|uniref:inorganic pyrophosphatase n=1 Tax=Zychaea mexicana TaxID=64656 RepID=UPI0022FEF9CB|nr:inorganic pyrophosphatase [Zychaea mexicana]KAI9493943.1 inorganic pyrophosphatase [Zychaea mexicana]
MKLSAIVFALAAAAISTVSGYNMRQIDALNTKKYRVYLEKDDGTPISPFHDVPLRPDPSNNTVYNMVVEIPRGKNAKVEIDKETPLNPLYHDTNKHDELKYIANIYPHHGYPGNYGSIPQTWENPHVPYKKAGTKGGDNDPVDVIDIGMDSGYPGQVKQVKLLGGLLMIDDDFTDWKLIAIDINDERASRYNDISDVEENICKDIQHWYKVYKVPQGDDENKFGYNGDFQDSKAIEHLIQETHGYWELLINCTAKADDIKIENLTVEGSKNRISANSKVVKDCIKYS